MIEMCLSVKIVLMFMLVIIKNEMNHSDLFKSLTVHFIVMELFKRRSFSMMAKYVAGNCILRILNAK